jgi:iron complex outermembrane receptor protein
VLLAPARAQAAGGASGDLMDLPLEKLVNVEITSASKYAEKASEAPSAVEVITADEIKTFGFQTLGDALNGLHGLYASNDRNYNYLGVNGFLRSGDYNSRILVMVNGHRMNDNIYDGASTGQEFLLDMALVDHIEYIPGPGSSIYGANAMEGVVNVITKKGSDINGLQVQGQHGSFDANEARLTYGKLFSNGVNALVSASEYYSAGRENLFFPEFNDPTTNNGIAHNMDGERSQRFFTMEQWQEYTFTAGFVNRYKQVPTASFQTLFNDPAYDTVDADSYAELKYNKAVTDKTSIEARGSYAGYDYHADFPYDANPAPPPVDRVVNYDAVSGRWWNGELNVVTTAFDRQKLVVGTEIQWDNRQHLWNNDILPFQLYQNSSRMGLRAGVYAQDDYKLRDDLTFSAGIRWDRNHMINGPQVNPRMALIWDARKDTTLKLLYGSAFRAPNVYERDLNTQGNALNPFNTEEHVRNVQAAAEWRPEAGTKLTGELFSNNFTRILTQDPVSLEFVNTGHYVAYGYDLEAQKQWAGGRSLRASFDHTVLMDDSQATAIGAIDSPKNVYKLLYSEPLFGDKARLGVENIFVDQRKTEQQTVAAPYSLFNATLTAKNFGLPGVDGGLSVYNLFNAHPQMVGGMGPGVVNDDQIAQKVIPLNGRSALFTLEATF